MEWGEQMKACSDFKTAGRTWLFCRAPVVVGLISTRACPPRLNTVIPQFRSEDATESQSQFCGQHFWTQPAHLLHTAETSINPNFHMEGVGETK